MRALSLCMSGLLVWFLTFPACSTVKTAPTGRAASDQLLTALTLEDAVYSLAIDEQIRGRTVGLEIVGLGNDISFLRGVLEAKVRLAGGRVVPDDATPEVRLITIVQVAGSDLEQANWNVPILLPSINSGITVSKIGFVENDIQIGRCRLWAYGINPEGDVLFQHLPVYAAHFVSNPNVLGVSLGKRSDIPELRERRGTAPVDLPQLPTLRKD